MKNCSIDGGGGIDVPPSPGWVRPADVMRVRKLRAKRHALQARMGGNSRPLIVQSAPKNRVEIKQKRNPFRRSPLKKPSTPSLVYNSSELSTDATLFNLLHNPQSQQVSATAGAFTFSQALRQQGITTKQEEEAPKISWDSSLVFDWSLKTKIRFIADTPLPWKHNFKMSEEASGTTGMARCIWGGHTDNGSSDLDTSPNAEFYQRCLVWQHPSLPGVTLFPRDGIGNSRAAGSAGVTRSAPGSTGPYADLSLASVLHASWCEALRSLHQLLRVRQCPFFYVCAPTFTVLYRAAGVCSIPHAHALITPTTRGLRRAMREEGIEYKMPFYRQTLAECSAASSSSASASSKCSPDSDSTTASCRASPPGRSPPPCGVEDDNGEEEEEEENEDAEGDTEEATSFLANLGVDTSQFTNLNPNRTNASTRDIDRSPLSLTYVADPDTQALTNFLLNSPSCVGGTGPLAGVPPTLLAPVAFQGGTLLPYKVKGGSVRVRGNTQYTMEVSGPLLPHAPLQLSTLLGHHLPSFTLTAAPLAHTLSFSNCTNDLSSETMTKAFAEEGLVDCGLDGNIRSLVCQPLPSPDATPAPPLPPSYRFVTYKEGAYTWTDQVTSATQ